MANGMAANLRCRVQEEHRRNEGDGDQLPPRVIVRGHLLPPVLTLWIAASFASFRELEVCELWAHQGFDPQASSIRTTCDGGGCVLVRWAVGFWARSWPLASALAAGVSITALGMGLVHGIIATPSPWLRFLPPPFAAVLTLVVVVIATKAYRDDAEILALLRRSR